MASLNLIGAEAVRYDLMCELGVDCDSAFALREQLDEDFTVADRGYAQLGDIADEQDRAIASDLIGGSMRAVVENLLEARLHQDRVTEALSGGTAFPDKDSAKDQLRQDAEIEMDIAGWGRALCSALDCLAAVSIGVLRIPLSIQRAQLSHLNSLPDLMPKASGPQQQAWQELLDLFTQHRDNFPKGWFKWLIGMRNLPIHRARQTRIHLQRTREADEPQLVVATENPAELNARMATFDLYLRRRPEVCDMQDLIEVSQAQDLWINEPAGNTLPGVFMVTCSLTEDLSRFLLDQWVAIGAPSADFPSPAAKWQLPRGLDPGFEGVAPLGKQFRASGSQLRGNPSLAKRLEVAEELSTRTDRLPGVDPADALPLCFHCGLNKP